MTSSSAPRDRRQVPPAFASALALRNDLIRGATFQLLGLVDNGRADADGVLRTLVITQAERKELLDRLLRYFPEAKGKEDKADTPPLVFIAGVYHRFLTRYRCADE
jgi:hypothetical protein